MIEPEADPDFQKSAGMLLFLALKGTPKKLRNKKKIPIRGSLPVYALKNLQYLLMIYSNSWRHDTSYKHSSLGPFSIPYM